MVDLLSHDSVRIHSVLTHTSTNFVELASLAGLDPSSDFRYLAMSGVDFCNCNLNGFDFTGSDLKGANFEGARILGAIFDHNQQELSELVGAIDYADALVNFENRSRAILSSYAGQMYLHAALVGDIATLQKYLQAGRNVDDEIEIGSSGRTALIHIATRTSHYGPEPGVVGQKGAEFLLQAGANVNHAMPEDGWTALLQAAHQGTTILVDLFLRYGADPNQRCRDDRTPLYGAVLSESLETVNLLLRAGADPNIVSSVFGSPLQKAKSRKLTKIIHLLKKAGAKR